MQSVRIKGYSFQLSEPYQAGSVMTKGEAQALNVLRRENIMDNMRAEVMQEISALAPGTLLTELQLQDLQRRLSRYDASYQFIERHNSPIRRGMIEAEAASIAAEMVEREQREIESEFDAATREKLVEEYAQLPAVIEEARLRASAKARANSGPLEDLL